jgi:aspartate/methionine/tyrosine aminotransferase
MKTMNVDALLSDRTLSIDVSGIRRVFELGARLEDPINFSIGQPDFPVPEPIKAATIAAIEQDLGGYTLTQGDPVLRDAIARRLADDVGWTVPSEELGLMVTSGTSGGLLLAFLALLDAGDEAIIPDPWFVIYPAFGPITGAKIVPCDTYPDFRVTAERVVPLLTERTKLLLIDSPSNPAGAVLSGAELRELVELCDERGIILVTDEIYDQFAYADAREDGRCPSAARYTDRMVLVRGFGKTYGCTGWRMGFAAGPASIIREMMKLQQYTFVCAPSMAQRGLAGAFDLDMSAEVEHYENRRDRVVAAFDGVANLVRPGGAFYAFVEIPPHLGLTASEFTERAIARNVLIIPGSVFSRRDTHFRMSYAVDDAKLDEGLGILREMMGG